MDFHSTRRRYFLFVVICFYVLKVAHTESYDVDCDVTEVRVILGEPAILPCRITITDSDFTTIWKKGDDIQDAEDVCGFLSASDTEAVYDPYTGRLELSSDGSISFISTQIEDTGRYWMYIMVGLTTKIVDLNLYVQVPPSIVSHPDERVSLIEEGTQTLSCTATGVPDPDIEWTLPPSIDFEDCGDRCMTANLTIDKVSRLDAGEYTCTATNGVGDPAVYTTTLDVQFQPSASAPSDVDIRASEGSTVTLECDIETNPAGFTTWMLDGQLIDLEGDRHESDYMEYDYHKIHQYLMISDIDPSEDYGYYTCVVGNELGISSVNISISGVPREVTVTSSSEGNKQIEYEVTWLLVPQEVPVDEWVLQWRKATDGFVADFAKRAIDDNMSSDPDQMSTSTRIVMELMVTAGDSYEDGVPGATQVSDLEEGTSATSDSSSEEQKTLTPEPMTSTTPVNHTSTTPTSAPTNTSVPGWMENIVPVANTYQAASGTFVIGDLKRATEYELRLFGRNEYGDGDSTYFLFWTSSDEAYTPTSSEENETSNNSGDRDDSSMETGGWTDADGYDNDIETDTQDDEGGRLAACSLKSYWTFVTSLATICYLII